MEDNDKSKKFYVMRDQKSAEGLEELIAKINLIRDTSEMNMIEIGSYVGESTLIFAKHFKNVISVDPYVNDYDYNDDACRFADFDLVYKKFMERTRSVMNITNFRITSDEGAEVLNKRRYDFVYIDGVHTYDQVKKDIINYLPLIKENGFIGGHDYANTWPMVKSAVDEVLKNPDRTFKDTSWLKKISNIK